MRALPLLLYLGRRLLGRTPPRGYNDMTMFAELAYTYEQQAASMAPAAGSGIIPPGVGAGVGAGAGAPGPPKTAAAAEQLALDAWAVTVAQRERDVKEAALDHFVAFLDDAGASSLPPSRRASAVSGVYRGRVV